jgi:uncharacterized protein (DUF1800 family)
VKKELRMSRSRREFLRESGLLSAGLLLPGALSACSGSAAQSSALASAPALATHVPTSAAQVAQQLATAEAWADSPASPQTDITHLLNRITYGPRPGDAQRMLDMGWDAFIEQQLQPEQIDDSAVEQMLAPLQTLGMSSAELYAAYPRREQQANGPGPRMIVGELQMAALLRAVYSKRQLFELMVDFWSNHFNIFIGKNQVRWLKTADDREVIRAHALGKFRDLLLASAKSPAMLVYLDNIDNVKPVDLPVDAARRAPNGINENYAREVMELHAVGADGGYDQADVLALAHTLTGWGMPRKQDNPDWGAFSFNANRHDDSAKRIDFLNLDIPAGSGIRGGEMALERLATHPKTAERIARKLAQFFVSDEPAPGLVQRAAQTFVDSDTDIRATLGVILRSDEFKASAGQKIKLPLRLYVSALRALDAQIAPLAVEQRGAPAVLQALQRLGQPFFGWSPPNGYPQLGMAWVNVGGMLTRWNMVFALVEGRIDGVITDLQQFMVSPGGAGVSITAGTLVDRLTGLLPTAISAPARATLVSYITEGIDDQTRLDATQLKRKLPGLVGLLLASPGFQVY